MAVPNVGTITCAFKNADKAILNGVILDFVTPIAVIMDSSGLLHSINIKDIKINNPKRLFDLDSSCKIDWL